MTLGLGLVRRSGGSSSGGLFDFETANVAWTNEFKTPPNIATAYDKWLQWRSERLAQFFTKCPLVRSTTYFVSNSEGNDSNAGTIGAPFKTLAKVQAVLDEVVGDDADIRFRFKRGDIWKETTGITVAKGNVTIDAYGSGPKPEFNRFTVNYLDADDAWTAAAGNRYTLSTTDDIAWLRLTDDKLGEVRGTHLIRQSSAATVEATDNSFWYDDVGDVLHVNLAGDNPNDFDMEAVISNSNSGVTLSADGGRCEGIRADGWGVHRTVTATQAEGIKSNSNQYEANLFIDCESYFGSSHTMAHYKAGAGAWGGKAVFYKCKSGYTKFNGSAGETVFNTYAQDSGMETWFEECECLYGTLKSSDWNYAAERVRGLAFFGHDTTQGAPEDSLLVVHNCRSPRSNIVGAVGLASLAGNGGSISTKWDLSLARRFVANSFYDAPLEASAAQMRFGNGMVYYNCVMNYIPDNLNPLALDGARGVDCYVIQCQINMDMSEAGASYALLGADLSGPYNVVHFAHNHIRLHNEPSSGNYGIDRFQTNDSGGDADTDLNNKDGRMWNNIISYQRKNGSSSWLAFANDSTVLKSNAYFKVTQDIDSPRGHNNDAGNVILLKETGFGEDNYQLRQAGTPDIRLSHDINGKKRTVSSPDIGPVDFSSGVSAINQSLPRTVLGSSNALSKWSAIYNGAKTQSIVIPILGDSQETSPGGQGNAYIPRLNYETALRFNGKTGRVYTQYFANYGGGSPTAKYMLRGGTAYINSSAIPSNERPPNSIPVKAGNATSNLGVLIGLQHDCADASANAGIPSGIDLFGYEREFYLDVWVKPYVGSNRLRVVQSARATSAPNYFNTPIQTIISDVDLNKTGPVEKIIFGPFINPDPLTNPYTNITIGANVTSTNGPELVAMQIRRAQDPGGIYFSSQSVGGYKTVDFLANHANCGEMLVDAFDGGSPCVYLHYGANDIYSASDTAADVLDDIDVLINALRGSSFYNNPNLLVIMATQAPRINGTAAQDTQADLLAEGIRARVNTDENFMVIDTRAMCEASGFTRATGATYLVDDVHYNALGAQLIARLEANALAV